MVYSIDNEDSFSNIEKWLNDIKTQSNPDVRIFLIGNKADLEDKRKVARAQGVKFCKDHNVSYFTETSAKTGLNVQNVFMEAAKQLYIQHEDIKNRISRPGSMTLLKDNDNDDNPGYETVEEENRNKNKCKC